MIKNLRRSVAEGGKIKIGGKGEQRQTRDGARTWRPPRKDDHFTITTTLREGGDPEGDLIVNEKIMTALVAHGWADDDGKIRKLPIEVLSDDIEQVFPTAYVAYSGKHMACRGDGETATRYIGDGGELLAEPQQVQCPCERLEKDDKGGRRCKFTGILHCALRLPGHAVLGSVYRWRTTSEISVSQIVTHLQDVILPNAGTLRGLPLMLVLRPQQVNPGGRLATVYVCHIDLCEELVIAQRQALEAATMRRELASSLGMKLLAGPAVPLELPGSEDTSEQAAVAAEYYPDEVVGTTPAGAEVQGGLVSELINYKSPPDDMDHSLLDAPLVGLTPPEPEPPTAPPAPPAVPAPHPAPAQPAPAAPAAAQPKGRTRRTRCTVCGELKHGVKKGMCEECATPQAPPPIADSAPEISPGPPIPPARPDSATTTAPQLRPWDRIQQAWRAAAGRGIDQEDIITPIEQAYPDAQSRRPQDWSQDDADNIEGILGGLPTPGAAQ